MLSTTTGPAILSPKILSGAPGRLQNPRVVVVDKKPAPEGRGGCGPEPVPGLASCRALVGPDPLFVFWLGVLVALPLLERVPLAPYLRWQISP